MNALVVFETMFGNTRQIAEAIAAGLSSAAWSVTVTDVVDAPSAVPAEVDLVVVGGPTHAFSMSRESTRADAAARGAEPGHLTIGMREWINGLPHDDRRHRMATFDTRADMPLLPGAASRSAAKVARRLGFRSVTPESFLVHGYEGPLVDGELERASTWGASLATSE